MKTTETKPYRFNVGQFQCTVIRDGGHMGTAGFLFANAPTEELNQVLKDYRLDAERIPSSWNCLLINTDSKKILLDTGIGSMNGHLIESLHSQGVHEDQIDMVILSHGHPDHIGGCTDADGQLQFPNARYVISQAEWDFWTAENNLTKLDDIFGEFARKNLPPLRERLDLVGDEGDILPGITIVPTPGHTPGHIGLELSSEGDHFFFLADAVLHPIHVQYPNWTSKVDMDLEEVVKTRHSILERVAAQKALVLFYHFDFPALGYVRQEGKKWHWQPL